MLLVILLFITLVFFILFAVLLCTNVFAKHQLNNIDAGLPLKEKGKCYPSNLTTLISSERQEIAPLELDELVDILWNSPIENLPLEQKCVEAFGITLYRRDLQKLKLGDWINDEIVNFYMALIVNRSQCLRPYPKVYAFNTYFYGAYTDKGYAGVRRWTKNIDIFSNDILLIPIHRGAHWCLVVVDLIMEKLEFYDSTLSDGSPILINIRKYLMEEHQEKKGMRFDMIRWLVQSLKGIPVQKNGYDCGVFLCAFAEHASRRARIEFSQTDMPRFRAQMTYELYYTRLFL